MQRESRIYRKDVSLEWIKGESQAFPGLNVGNTSLKHHREKQTTKTAVGEKLMKSIDNTHTKLANKQKRNDISEMAACRVQNPSYDL